MVQGVLRASGSQVHEHSAMFLQCLLNLDIDLGKRLWKHVNPHLPQPKGDDEMRLMLHHARTQANSVPLKLRAYSHAWLCERSLPSGLPDALKPSAERMYPVVVTAVGVAVKPFSDTPEFVERAKEIEQRMSGAVAEMYADGVTDPGRVKARMEEARRKVR